MAGFKADGLLPEDEYYRQKKLREMQLESLVVPAANAAKEAGELINSLPKLWQEASEGERRRIVLSMLDAVYVDAKKYKIILAIKPKPPFRPIFQVAVSKNESKIRIINEPLKGSSVFVVVTGENYSLARTNALFLFE